MDINILSEEYYEDTVSKRLVAKIKQHAEDNDKFEDAILYYHYPLFRELDEDLKYPSLMLISPYHGIIIFQCSDLSRLNTNKANNLDSEVSHIFSLIYSKLIKSKNKELKINRMQLAVNLETVLFLPNLNKKSKNMEMESKMLSSEPEITNLLDDLEGEKLSQVAINEILTILEGSKGIIKPKERNLNEEMENTKAFLINKLETEIANFDKKQKYAALSQLEGPQRIRGLAGSGKTIILAMKAALLHLKYPNKKILYTFKTKSLYDYIKRLIRRFYKQYHDQDLNWKNVNIRHAWGGNNINGVYYDACKINSIDPINFSDAKRQNRKDPFDYVCNNLLKKTNGNLKTTYDYVLIDEAQDFKPAFYQICREIVKNDCLVWAYDELQDIFNVQMQNTIETFENKYGAKGINLPELQEEHPEMDNDIVLPKCYRNPREILLVAHSLGFGFYNEQLIQSLENNDHWKDLGYEVVEGDCNEDEEMKILRPKENSPLSISNDQTINEIVDTYMGEDITDEIDWISKSIINDINIEKMRADDIMVICLDDRHAKKYFLEISDILYENDIYSHNLLSNTYEKGFKEDNCVTLSTIYRAKGNEAPIVYVIGIDSLAYDKNSRTTRNKIFTAFTRAKAWLRVSGTGGRADELINEIKEAKTNFPYATFIHKSENALKRDLSEINIKKSKLREILKEAKDKANREGLTEKEIEEEWNNMLFGSDKE